MKALKTLPRFIYRQQQLHSESSGELSDLLTSIALAIKVISRLVATAGFKGLDGYTGETNIQGEKTYKLDDQADKILVDLLSTSGYFGSIVSEERDGAIETDGTNTGAQYIVAFDPLDGSSNIGTNIPVGTIFTIFKKKKKNSPAGVGDFLQKGTEVVAAGYSVYGAKTSFVYSCRDGVHGFTLDPDIGEFILTEESMTMPKEGGIFSINEGYTGSWDQSMRETIAQFKTKDSPAGKPYSARYVGSLVADFDRTLRKGGVFLHPANKDRPNGKLRLLYECIPLAFIAEQAGGMSLGHKGSRILDIMPESIHSRSPFITGSRREVEWVQKRL